MTMIALTGITLTALKYRDNDHSNVIHDHDYEEEETMNPTRLNPKFYSYNHSSIAKRSTNIDQYSIEDKNVSMIDEEKREKVKQVQPLYH